MLDLIFAVAAFAAGSLLSSSSSKNSSSSSSFSRSRDDIIDMNPIKKPSSSDVFYDIKNNNREISDLIQKERRDGCSTEIDRYRILALEKQRDALFKQYQDNKQFNILTKAERENDKFSNFNITQEKLHLIQYHVGETVLGKVCPICKKPMILQFGRNIEVRSLGDFFWACTGWYSKQCNFSESFTLTDMELFTENNKNEFHVSNDELSLIFNNSEIQKHTLNRVDSHRNQTVEEYVCPFHKEPLILREKKKPTGVLDAFFLGCPLWAKENCSYVLKLKSAAQLASFLNKTENQGIL